MGMTASGPNAITRLADAASCTFRRSGLTSRLLVRLSRRACLSLLSEAKARGTGENRNRCRRPREILRRMSAGSSRLAGGWAINLRQCSLENSRQESNERLRGSAGGCGGPGWKREVREGAGYSRRRREPSLDKVVCLRQAVEIQVARPARGPTVSHRTSQSNSAGIFAMWFARKFSQRLTG